MLGVNIILFLTLSRVGLCSLQEKQTDFGFKVFLQLTQESLHKNVAFSPYGLCSILAMAQLGAAGQTLKTLTTAMGFSLQERQMARQQHFQQRYLSSEKKVDIASGVMVDRKMIIQKKYQQSLVKTFQTHPHQIDFTKSEQAVTIINAWISDHTAGTIPEILEVGSLTDETRLVFINALHFHRLWKVPFNPKLTEERMFHCGNGSAVNLPMMKVTNQFNYGEFVTADGVEYDVIEVPYEGDSLSLFLMSPFDLGVPLNVLSVDLSSRRIKQWREEMRNVTRQLAIPRFTLTSEVNLKSALLNVGLGQMFNPASADFSDISTDERLFVSKVLQKIKLEVNEQGTKGTVATAAVMFSRMAVEEVTLDRPFLFIIQHKHTGSILLMGQFNHPQQQ